MKRSVSTFAKIAAGWVLLALAVATTLYAFFVYPQFDKPAAAMLTLAMMLGGVGGALALWSD